VGAHGAAVRIAWLFGVMMAQGLVGFVQYLTQLPELLVGVHMAGACLVWLATLAVLFATRTRTPSPQDPVDHDLRVMIDAESRR
jgi:cytochrome c oxidase assembly protein subunit 15